MPQSFIVPPPAEEKKQKVPGPNFTGDVYLEMLHLEQPYPGTASLANVTFTPCARTNWHTHVGGQYIQVLRGSGWICDQGEKPRRIKEGDKIWAQPGTTHWHGADKGEEMCHFVVGVGETKWHHKVNDEEYNKGQAA